MQINLTRGSITGALIRFSLPLIAGNLLQQLYNITDTLIVGRFLGPNALAAVGSSYTLMTFITSILLGLQVPHVRFHDILRANSFFYYQAKDSFRILISICQICLFLDFLYRQILDE